MQLEKIQLNNVKISELVMRTLIKAIEVGQIRVGEELPSERELAETLGIGRGSLRECLAVLEFLGAVGTTRNNRKVVLRDNDYIEKAISFVRISNAMDTQSDFGEFRRINEVAIVGLACERGTEEDFAALRQAIMHLEKEPDNYMHDVEFHDALAVASHNAMLAATMHFVNSMIADIRERFLGRPDYQRLTHESHCAIYEAVRARNVKQAQEEMEKHLRIVEDFFKKYPDKN